MKKSNLQKFSINKVSNSGMRVLELLKLLTLGPIKIPEFMEIVAEKGDAIYRKEVVLKYINTLKLLGFNVEKIRNKYFLKNSIVTLDYSRDDLSLLWFIEDYAAETKQKDIEDFTNDALQKIERTFSPKTKEILKNRSFSTYKVRRFLRPRDRKIRLFEKYCADKQKLEIKYKQTPLSREEFFKISPLKIIYKKKQSFLIAYDCKNAEYKEFLIDYITHVQQTLQKITYGYSKAVIFKLKGRLAKSYVLKKGEKVLDNGEDYLIVSNEKEYKNFLLRRLLRYYDKCEVVYPIEFRTKMLNLIGDIQKIYE